MNKTEEQSFFDIQVSDEITNNKTNDCLISLKLAFIITNNSGSLSWFSRNLSLSIFNNFK